MEFRQTINANVTASELSGRIARFLHSRGYKNEEILGKLVYKRGSYFGSRTSFTPKGWLCRVTVEVKLVDSYSSSAVISYDVNTMGQIVAQKEREFWQNEVNNLVETANTGTINLKDNKALKASIRQNILITMLVLIVMGGFFGLSLLVFQDYHSGRLGLFVGAFVSYLLVKLLFKGERT